MIPAATVTLPARPTRQALAITLGLTAVFLTLGLLSPGHANPRLAWTFYSVTALLLLWQAVLFITRAGGKSPGFRWEFVPVRSHYVQALVQFSIYVYWGWYWRNVYAEAPLILSQVVFLYVIDGLLSWTRGQTWRLGFGPWPIIFSTNLFMWFRDDWFAFQFLMVATGLFGKQFIRWRREGKVTHIFNPSAFALTLFSLALILTGTTDHTWGEQIAITQGRPPHLYTEIFLCGMVVQYFFSVTLLTFSAAAMLAVLSLAYQQFTGVYAFIDSNIPIAVFLGLHLLMTDPATTPRSSIGRIIFGSLYGIGVFGAFFALEALGIPAFYDKLVVVPVLNLLTPAIDHLAALGAAGKFGRWEAATGPRRMNLRYMSLWIAVFVTMLASGFVEAPHPGATIGFWKKAAEENRPHARRNLQTLLGEFMQENLDDPTRVFGAIGGGAQSRGQTLGILCEQVATIYFEGKLVPSNTAVAIRYFAKACDFGNVEACANLAILNFGTNHPAEKAGINLEHVMNTLEKTVDKTPNGRIRYLVGRAYELGNGRVPDKARARQCYEHGAILGDLACCRNLARMELAAEGGPADHTGAARWLQVAADQQDGPSCLSLARMYHMGDGVANDESKAIALLRKACDLGVQPACELLRQSK